jgi:hypothetical protein
MGRSILAVFDIDGTLADESFLHRDSTYKSHDQNTLLQFGEIPATCNLAREFLRSDAATVVYLTARDERHHKTTWIWLLGHGLFPAGTYEEVDSHPRVKLICCPSESIYLTGAVPTWKSQVVRKLALESPYSDVLVFENKAETLEEINKKWNLPSNLTLVFVDPQHNVERFEQAVSANFDPNLPSTMSRADLVNFKLLMNRFADKSWIDLLSRQWKSKSELLDAALGYINGNRNKQRFRQHIEELWQVDQAKNQQARPWLTLDELLYPSKGFGT